MGEESGGPLPPSVGDPAGGSMEEESGDPLPLCHRAKMPPSVSSPSAQLVCSPLTAFLDSIPGTPRPCSSYSPQFSNSPQWFPHLKPTDGFDDEETMMSCTLWNYSDDDGQTVSVETMMAGMAMSNHAAAEPVASAAALSPLGQQNLQPMNLDLQFTTASSKEASGPSSMGDEVAPMAPQPPSRPLPSCTSPSTEHILLPEASHGLAQANDATPVAMAEQGNVPVEVPQSKEQLLLQVQTMMATGLLAQRSQDQLHVLLNFLEIWSTQPKCVEDYYAQAQHSGASGSSVPRSNAQAQLPGASGSSIPRSNAQAQHSRSKPYARMSIVYFRRVLTHTDLAICTYCDKIFEGMAIHGTSALLRHSRSCSHSPKTPQKRGCQPNVIFSQSNILSMQRAANAFNIKLSRQNEDKVKVAGTQLMSSKRPPDINSFMNHHPRSGENGGDTELNEVDHKDVKVETGDTSRKRKKCASSESEAWLHFTKVLDGSGIVVKGKCKYCGKFLKAHPKINGTSRLLRHAEDIHGIELESRSPKTKKRRVAPTTKAKVAQSSECCGLAPDKVPLPSDVIMLEDSGDTVGKISRLEVQLLHRINSTPEQEVLVQINDVTIRKKALESLADSELEDGPPRYLQDDIIDAYIYILKDKKKDDTRAHGRVYMETTVRCQQLLYGRACSIGTKKNFGIKYLKHDLIFLPINQNRNHWYLAVINTKKQEVQVLDSKKQFQERKELKLMLKKMEQCLELASNEVQSNSWPDYKLASWKVMDESQIPKQIDMSSCGLYVIKYMEYWTGENMSKTFTQADIELFRLKLAAELLSSPLNKA